MINIFRSYNPINVLWLAIVLLVLRISYLIIAPGNFHMVLTEPFLQTFLPWPMAGTISTGSSMLLAGIMVLLQAVLLNYLINYYNLLGKPSFLPGLMYITLSGLFTPFLLLSAPLLCNFVMIWMLYKLLQLYSTEDINSIAYDLGLLVALGALIYLPFTYLLLAVWAALIIFLPFNWRNWAATLIGYATVFFFVGVYYFLHDRLTVFYRLWQPLATPFAAVRIFNHYNYLLLIPVAIILILGLFRLQENFFKSYVLIRKAFQLLIFIFLLAGCSFYVRPLLGLTHFLLCVMPVAIFFAYYFLYARQRWFYETLYFLLVAGIVYFQFNTF